MIAEMTDLRGSGDSAPAKNTMSAYPTVRMRKLTRQAPLDALDLFLYLLACLDILLTETAIDRKDGE